MKCNELTDGSQSEDMESHVTTETASVCKDMKTCNCNETVSTRSKHMICFFLHTVGLKN